MFVEVGTTIGRGILCVVIEAMKLFNEIESFQVKCKNIN
jgi:biotin carboxyl carrier protein